MSETRAVEDADVQAIASLLHEEGYRAKIEPDTGVIRSATGGLNISIFPSAKNIQVRCGIVREDYRIGLKDVNDFNARYRFGKLYIDDDGDIVLESDHLFDVQAGDAAGSLREIIRIFEGLIRAMSDLIREAETQEKEESAGLSTDEKSAGLPTDNE